MLEETQPTEQQAAFEAERARILFEVTSAVVSNLTLPADVIGVGTLLPLDGTPPGLAIRTR